MERKYIKDTLAKEYKTWLLSYNNPNFTGDKKYDSYDYYLDRLIRHAVELGLIESTDIALTDINWVNGLINVYNCSKELRDFVASNTGHNGGISSLKLYQIFIGQKNSAIVSNTAKVDIEDTHMRNSATQELNLILYGPPGTGKTYNTIKRAVEIIEQDMFEDNGFENIKARYDKYLHDGRIAFTTFHQSYGYEEFIEGIKPDFEADEIKYKRADGVFKAFCDKAVGFKFFFTFNYEFNKNATVWKVSLGGAGKNEIREDCMNNNHIRIAWDSYGETISDETDFKNGGNRILNAFINDMNMGDIVLSCYSTTEIDAIGVIDGEYEWHDEYNNYKRVRKVKWLIKDIKKDITEINNGKRMMQPAVHRLDISPDEIAKLIDSQNKPDVKVECDYTKPYVFIIDEINRGNVSKIFGELITLIEPTKRLGAEEEMTCKLPYSGKAFGVPKNVYILGTMNTADRSLVQLDAALRRRFAFEEMMPDYAVINEHVGVVDSIDIAGLLSVINNRITCLLDKEHQIGHSYFLKLKENKSVKNLAEIFKKNIIPLLQEYFFDDFEAVKDILNGVFIKEENNPFDNGKRIYSINLTENPADYIKIYNSYASTVADNG